MTLKNKVLLAAGALALAAAGITGAVAAHAGDAAEACPKTDCAPKCPFCSGCC